MANKANNDDLTEAGENQLPETPEIDNAGFEFDNDVSVERFLKSSHIEDKDVTVYLYKLIGTQRVFCDEYAGEVPTVKIIGTRFGGGKYTLIVLNPRGKNTSRTVNIHPIYDKIKAETDSKAYSMPGNVPAVAPQNNLEMFSSMMATFQSMMSGIVLPLLQASKPVTSSVNNDLTPMIMAQKMIMDSMKGNVADSMKFYKQIMNNALTTQTPEREDTEMEDLPMEPEKKSWMDIALPLIENLIPLLVKNDGQARMIGATARAIPQVQDIIQNPTKVNEAYLYLVKREGIEKANILMKNLGMKIPIVSQEVKKPVSANKPQSLKKEVK